MLLVPRSVMGGTMSRRHFGGMGRMVPALQPKRYPVISRTRYRQNARGGCGTTVNHRAITGLDFVG